MVVKLVFLGRLEDAAGGAEMLIDAATGETLAALLARLETPLRAALTNPRTRIALNGALQPPGANPAIGDGDELAFLPPVSGG